MSNSNYDIPHENTYDVKTRQAYFTAYLKARTKNLFRHFTEINDYTFKEFDIKIKNQSVLDSLEREIIDLLIIRLDLKGK